jgi:hypothetical protein
MIGVENDPQLLIVYRLHTDTHASKYIVHTQENREIHCLVLSFSSI